MHQASVGKLVEVWRKEKIFPEAALQHFQGFVGSQADPEPTDHLFSPPGMPHARKSALQITISCLELAYPSLQWYIRFKIFYPIYLSVARLSR